MCLEHKTLPDRSAESRDEKIAREVILFLDDG
jgi:hypothetical protein